MGYKLLLVRALFGTYRYGRVLIYEACVGHQSPEQDRLETLVSKRSGRFHGKHLHVAMFNVDHSRAKVVGPLPSYASFRESNSN